MPNHSMHERQFNDDPYSTGHQPPEALETVEALDRKTLPAFANYDTEGVPNLQKIFEKQIDELNLDF